MAHADRARRLLQAGTLVLGLLGGSACEPPAPALPIAEPVTAQLVRFAGRPALRVAVREGDPAAALAVAVAGDGGATDAALGAALVESRLAAAGLDGLRVTSDAAGLRLVWFPVEVERLGAFFEALVATFAHPVDPGGSDAEGVLAAARLRLATLGRVPRVADALAPVMACQGGARPAADAGGVPSAAPELAAALEAARVRFLVTERAAIGIVGDSETARRVTVALEQSGPWPHGSGPLDAPLEARGSERHGVYAATELGPGGARLDVALPAPRAIDLVRLARRLAPRAAPLAARLAADAPDFQPTALQVTALPGAGCLTASFVARAAAVDAAGLVREAALLTEAVRREARLAASASDAANETAHARRSVFAHLGDVREAAQVAAWWEACGQGDAPAATGGPDDARSELDPSGGGPRLDSALGVSALGAQALAPDEVQSAYRDALSRVAAARASAAIETTVREERGQGELWLLLAPRCGLETEAPAEHGLAALAAEAAVLGQPADGGVVVEPWLSGDGVGLLAHGAAGSTAETSTELATRVAAALGHTLARVPGTEGAVEEARAVWLGGLERPEERAAAAFAAIAAPEHPARLAPRGVLAVGLQAGASATAARWRALWERPVRLAALTNASAAQLLAAEQEIERWLPPRAGGSCPSPTPPDPPRAGTFATSEMPELWLTAGALVPGDALPLAELAELALAGDGGAVARATPDSAERWHVRVAGGAFGAALTVHARARPGRLEALRDALVRSFASLDALDEPAFAELLARAARRSIERRLEPRERLRDLWRGTSPGAAAAPSYADWRRLVRERLAPTALIVVRGP
ncbi:MAG: hypothetical protein IT373_12795 [Polyangiaceae bacterium]|nr:hypothetical protein [Polyangiaceae bacterium]